MHFARKLPEGLGSTRERCWNYVVLVFENTPKISVVQERMQLKHSSHMVKVGGQATCQHFNSWRILKERTKPAAPFRTVPQEPWCPGKRAKLDHAKERKDTSDKLMIFKSDRKNGVILPSGGKRSRLMVSLPPKSWGGGGGTGGGQGPFYKINFWGVVEFIVLTVLSYVCITI